MMQKYLGFIHRSRFYMSVAGGKYISINISRKNRIFHFSDSITIAFFPILLISSIETRFVY
jgi:hypothetical protein